MSIDREALKLLIERRIPAALKRITDGHGLMRVPAEDTDPDLVLADCLQALQRLLAGETREAVIADAREYEKQHEAAEQSTIKFVKDYIKTLPHTEAVSECLHCSLNYLVSRFIDKHRAFDALLSSPSPHDDAGADKPAGVPVVELEKLASDWNMDYENNPGLLSPDDCADQLRALFKRFKDPHHG